MTDLNIQISDLRTRITFQQPTVTKDPGGAQKTTYINVPTNPTVWAQWINDHGQEAVSSDAEKSVQRATVRIRHRSDIVETWQVLKGNEPWSIISPPDNVRDLNRWIELRVERVKGTV